jgi:probable FeS assembly SUF system protein SufT
MPSSSHTELVRDCVAIQIPSGSNMTLPKGTPFDVTQTLGGTYTIHTPLGLFRVASQDADALGVDAASQPQAASPGEQPSSGSAADSPVTEEQVWETLRTCYDPEIPVNIVDLGLVYEMGLRSLPTGNQRVDVKMTLTAPGCGMGGVIAGEAQQKLLMLDGVEEATVEIVWDPPWHQSRITEEGRRILGLE